MVDKAGAVEENVDRPDLARERLDRLGRAGVELARVGVEAFEAGDVDVRRDERAPSRAKASAVPRPMPAAAAVNNATLPANRPAIGPLLRFCFPRPSGPRRVSGDIVARS